MVTEELEGEDPAGTGGNLNGRGCGSGVEREWMKRWMFVRKEGVGEGRATGFLLQYCIAQG